MFDCTGDTFVQIVGMVGGSRATHLSAFAPSLALVGGIRDLHGEAPMGFLVLRLYSVRPLRSDRLHLVSWLPVRKSDDCCDAYSLLESSQGCELFWFRRQRYIILPISIGVRSLAPRVQLVCIVGRPPAAASCIEISCAILGQKIMQFYIILHQHLQKT